MPKTRLILETDPWRGLPARVADLIEGEIDPISTEILASIAREVPEYARPLEGRFGRGIWRWGGAGSGRGGRSDRSRRPTGSAPGSPGGGSPTPAATPTSWPRRWPCSP